MPNINLVWLGSIQSLGMGVWHVHILYRLTFSKAYLHDYQISIAGLASKLPLPSKEKGRS